MNDVKLPCYHNGKVVGFSIIKKENILTTITDKELSKSINNRFDIVEYEDRTQIYPIP